MMHFSLDFSYVEKKLISLSVGDPRSTTSNPQRILKFSGRSFTLILLVILRAKYKKLQ